MCKQDYKVFLPVVFLPNVAQRKRNLLIKVPLTIISKQMRNQNYLLTSLFFYLCTILDLYEKYPIRQFISQPNCNGNNILLRRSNIFSSNVKHNFLPM